MNEPIPGSYEHRFSGLARLYGREAHLKLKNAHICVVGIGGVGSWAVEAIARTGIQEITMVDWDDLCYSNINRQIHALNESIGKPKIEVMADRIKAINPECKVHCIRDFFNEDSAKDILSHNYTGVIDAIDQYTPKCHLIASCKRLKLPIVSVGAAGGMVDPTLIKVVDLNRTYQDPLLAKVRRKLRVDFNFPRTPNEKFRVPCVFSSEHKIIPNNEELDCDIDQGNGSTNLGCDFGYGSATFITGSFAFHAVSKLFQVILRKA